MADDPSSITRRSILKNAAIGSTSVIGIREMGVGDSRAATTSPRRNRNIRTITNDRTIEALLSTVTASAAYETYVSYFEDRAQIELQTDDPAVYEVQRQGSDTNVTCVSFDLFLKNQPTAADDSTDPIDERQPSSDVTFHVRNRSVQESAAVVLRRLDQHTNKGTKFWIENGAIRQESITMTRSEHSVQMTDQSRSGVSTQSMFGVGCNDCTEIMRAICEVGCAAPSSLICTVSTGGIGGIACSVTADLICGQIPLPNDCATGKTHKHRQLCNDAGFC